MSRKEAAEEYAKALKEGQKEYKEKFGIKSTRIPFKLIHSNDTKDSTQITEYSEYITSTNSRFFLFQSFGLIFATYLPFIFNISSCSLQIKQ